LNLLADEIVTCIKDQNFSKGYCLCEGFIKQCELQFMEQLTIDTATDFVAAVLMFCQLAKLEKKPWRALLPLERIRGALRFMEDYIRSSEVYASSCYSVASFYAGAAELGKATYYFQKAAEFAEEKNTFLSAISDLFFYSFSSGKSLSEEVISFAKSKLGEEAFCEILSLAEKESKDRIRTDPIEQSEEFSLIRYELEKELDEILSQTDLNGRAFCLVYWEKKKELLQKKYGFPWKSPVELNPTVQFQ